MFKHMSRLMAGIILLVAATGCVDQPAAETVEPTVPPATETASPEPTAAPTNTPAPTSTPVPTSTPLPTLSPDLIAYRDKVLPLAEEIIASAREIDLLMADFTPDLYGDLDWLDTIGPHLMTVGNDHFALAAITPPEEASDIHAAILDASQTCDEATDLLAEGILHLEDDRVASGSEVIETCIVQIGKGVRMLDEIAGR